MNNKCLADKVVDTIEKAFLSSHGGPLKVVGILEGGTKKTRNYSHIFVEGKLYGGKIGSMLCRRPWRTQHIYRRGEIKKDICPQCAAKLRKMAIIAADLFSRDLLAIASGAAVAAISAEDTTTILEEYARREHKPKVENPQLPMFSLEETSVRVERTQPWKVPSPPPSSTSASSSR